MGRIFPDNSLAIGNTPLVRLNRVIPPGGARVLAKVEARNPAFSVKCRVGAALVWDAERRGELTPGKELIEPTSGNTGIALAFVAAARGIPLTLTMPDGMSRERCKVLRGFGVKLILTPNAAGMAGAIQVAERLAREQPDRYLLLHQFNNPANPDIHEQTTGPEIWADTDGQVDILVAGVGTGGTLTGISRYFEQVRGQPLHSVAVEPAGSAVIAQHLAGEALHPNPHQIQGIGAGFIPNNLDLGLVDQVESVSDEEAIEFARRLTREEGLLSGISCGAAIAVAARLAGAAEHRGKTIVAILPDSGERYLSTVLFQDLEV